MVPLERSGFKQLWIVMLNIILPHILVMSRLVMNPDGICDAHFVRIDATMKVWINRDNFTTISIQTTASWFLLKYAQLYRKWTWAWDNPVKRLLNIDEDNLVPRPGFLFVVPKPRGKGHEKVTDSTFLIRCILSMQKYWRIHEDNIFTRSRNFVTVSYELMVKN